MPFPQSVYPAGFSVQAHPHKFPQAQTLFINTRLALELGIAPESLADRSGAQSLISGPSALWADSPVALAYAGHQFGNFTMLGDGRAHLMGRVISKADGQSYEVQLKGSGRTPFSRRGDGLAALKPMLREYLISEYMNACGIPTSRILAVIATGERVQRERESPGAIAVRVARSHLRVGTVEYAAARGDVDALRSILEFAAGEFKVNSGFDRVSPQGLFDFVLKRQARLISQWMAVGFVHGVMNTDNMALSGETLDYGPCGFMNRTDPQTVFSSIDHRGRYAYGAQPAIAKWNLARFAESLLTLEALSSSRSEPLPEAIEEFKEQLKGFDALFKHHWQSEIWKKLGFSENAPVQAEFVESSLNLVTRFRADWTSFFVSLETTLQKWGDWPSGDSKDHLILNDSAEQMAVYSNVRIDPETKGQWLDWLRQWSQLQKETRTSVSTVAQRLSQVNPKVIPRNQRVEEVLDSVAGDPPGFDPSHFQTEMFSSAVAEMRAPFGTLDETVQIQQKWKLNGQEFSCGFQTFCGT